MITTKGYAAHQAKESLKPFTFDRRDVGPNDILIEISFCGVCHSDLHQVKNEWGGGTYPMVPGHEMVGTVRTLGSNVKRFKLGDTAGVGCFVDSCRSCDNCKQGLEQFCSKTVWSYNSLELDGQTKTYGGYSKQMVVDENYALKIAAGLPLERVAPLLCAGITTYSPLKHWNVREGQRVGIIGLGGLGHMAVKFAVSMGAKVTVFSSSPSKEADAKKLGAHYFAKTNDPKTLPSLAGQFDFLLDTVSAPHNLNPYLELLKTNGAMVLVGVPPEPTAVQAFSLILNRRSLAGSLIGGIQETQEMLDYCAEKNILADVEVIHIQKINEAYKRMLKSDVKYRFVIDCKTI